jgi:hypothetical protein
MPLGVKGREPTLLIKANSLHLKYLVRLKKFRLVFLSVGPGWLAYGIELADDPQHPAIIWSLLEYEDEVAALRALIERPACVVHLFNDIAVDVAWAEVDIDLRQGSLPEVLRSAVLHPATEKGAAEEVLSRLDDIHSGALHQPAAFLLGLPAIAEWHEVQNTYITNRISHSHVSIFSTDEGGQQEEIALWLTDNLQPIGAVKSPQVYEPNKPPRELSDLLLSHESGAFLIESKSLSILARENLPDRQRLSRDVVKHIRKASDQLAGGIKNLRRGFRITDLNGNEVTVERVNPPHAIILVPDLTLIVDATEFGGPFLKRFYQDTGGCLHFLDPAELLRIVQVAEMMSRRSETVSPIMAFDWYLVERVKRAVTNESPALHLLFRFADEVEDSGP